MTTPNKLPATTHVTSGSVRSTHAAKYRDTSLPAGTSRRPVSTSRSTYSRMPACSLHCDKLSIIEHTRTITMRTATDTNRQTDVY